MEVARSHAPPLLKGNALDVLPQILAAAPAEPALCLYHTHTLNQFSPGDRERLYSMIAEHSFRRTVFTVSMEWLEGNESQMTLITFRSGARSEEALATYGDHAGWLRWL